MRIKSLICHNSELKLEQEKRDFPNWINSVLEQIKRIQTNLKNRKPKTLKIYKRQIFDKFWNKMEARNAKKQEIEEIKKRLNALCYQRNEPRYKSRLERI